jgi:hypothetical protein
MLSLSRKLLQSGSSQVVTDLRRFLNLLEADAGQQTRTLYMTHCSRDDIILGFLSHCQRMRASGQTNFEAALMLCGHYKVKECDGKVVVRGKMSS